MILMEIRFSVIVYEALAMEIRLAITLK